MLVLAVADAAVASLVIFTVVGAGSRAELAELLADRQTFLAFGMALLALAGTRVWSAIDVAWRTRPEHGRATVVVPLVASLIAVAAVAPVVVAADYVRRTDDALDNVFADEEAMTAFPSRVTTRNAMVTTVPSVSSATTTTTQPDATPTTVAPTTTTSTTTTTTTTLPPIIGEARVNVLLLGGDAGPGRWSLRTDTMVVVSIDPATGDTAMISVPRNLQRLPFPEGTALDARYPGGFPEIANAVYPLVGLRPELVGDVDNPGAQAIKLGIAQLLGMPIHYYVLVDMAGFVDVVDALGGIEINVARRVPSPGNPPGAKHEVPPYIEAGVQHMDGTIALAYSRSRSADSDYQRMSRQRCVLAALTAAATPSAVALGLPDLVAAFGAAVRTDIPRDRLAEMTRLLDVFTAAGGLATVRTLHLAPPLVDPARWDPLAVRAMVAAVVEPAAPAATAAPVSVPAKVLTDSC